MVISKMTHNFLLSGSNLAQLFSKKSLPNCKIAMDANNHSDIDDDPNDNGLFLVGIPATENIGDKDSNAKQSRRSGWASGTSKSKSEPKISEKQQMLPNEETTMIPNLEDFEEEDLAAQVAQAPKISVNKVATYTELDSDLARHGSIMMSLDNTDLKALHKNLVPESDVQEDDTVWTWDQLLTELASEITSDVPHENYI